MVEQWVAVDADRYDVAFERLSTGLDGLSSLLAPVLATQVEQQRHPHHCPWCRQSNSMMFHPNRGGPIQNSTVLQGGCKNCGQNSQFRRAVLTLVNDAPSTERLVKQHDLNLRKCTRCNQKSSLFTQEQQTNGGLHHGCWRCDRRTHDVLRGFLLNEGKLFRHDPKQLFSEVVDSIKEVRATAAAPKSPKPALVESYTTAGLPEPFAKAMALDESNRDSILALWRCDWRSQYEDDDPLILAILDGRLSSSEGEYLHNVRSDHGALVDECIQTTLAYAWCHALLEAGFKGHIDAVEAARKGGEPEIVADINGILKQVKVDMLPPRRT
jgi:hypothetical protein